MTRSTSKSAGQDSRQADGAQVSDVVPPATFHVLSLPDAVELAVDRQGRGRIRFLLGPDFAAQLAAEIVFIASRVAQKDMRPVFNRHLRARKAGAR